MARSIRRPTKTHPKVATSYPGSSKSRGKIGDIRSIVNEILGESRNRSKPEETSRFLQNESRVDKSRLKDSINKCRLMFKKRWISLLAEALEAAVRSEATSEMNNENSMTEENWIRWSTISKSGTSQRETSSSTVRWARPTARVQCYSNLISCSQ